MCYSVTGRVQTRLASLLAPALLAGFLVWRTGDQRYTSMLMVMVLVALDLDLFLYRYVIGYQARWQTYLLGAVEFFVTLAVVRVLGGTLPLQTIIAFYVSAWIGSQFLVNVVLPVADPMWAEHGGELFRPGMARPSIAPGLKGLTARARRFILAPGGEAITITSLLVLTVLELTVIPSTLTPVQVLAAVAGALAMGAFAWRVRGSGAATPGGSLALGLLIALLIRAPGPWPFLLAGACAAGFRSWLWLDRQPVFNGAAAAFVAVVLVIPSVYTADGQWGNSLLLPLAIANVALVLGLRSGRLVLVLTFMATLLLDALYLLHGRFDSLQISLPPLLPAYLLFFAGFVLPEQATTPDGWRLQAIMGLGVAAAGLAAQSAGVGLPFAVALLAWNYLWRLALAGAALYRRWTSRRARQDPAREDVAGTSRRAFLGTLAALAGSVVLGGAFRRLTGIDAAILSLPPEPVLAGGQAIPRFREVAGEAGIVLAHHGDASEGSPAVGTGVAWGDYNKDGLLDLYVTDHRAASHLYRNNGDGTFSDVAEQSGVNNPSPYTTSAVFVDYDNDGWPDLYVGVAHGPNVLYHNNRDGTFHDVTASSGLGDTGRTLSTAWADYDGDGYLDVFVVNYPDSAISFDGNSSIIENVRTVEHMYRPHNRLYHNNGDGTFSDVTHLLGDIAAPATRGFGFSAVWFDYNRDGRPDLYVAYDFGGTVQPNTMWRNDGPGGNHGWRFAQAQKEMGVAAAFNTMGVVSGDYDSDGWLDLAVTNIGPNLLYRNNRSRSFTDVAKHAGVTHAVDTVDNMLNPSMTWGLDFADLNNDGWLDLYLVAGTMYFENVPQANSLFLNDHAGGFIDVSAPSGTNDPGQGRSVAVGDYDGDGYLDMFVANFGQPPRLYRNLSRGSGNRWLRIELEGTRSNRDAVGARVELYAPGLPRQVREVQIGQGLGSCDDKVLHFGLGTASRVERIDVRWPSGQMQRLEQVKPNQVLKVREPGPSRWPPLS